MGNIMSTKNNNDLSGIDMAELIQMLKDAKTNAQGIVDIRSPAYKELNRRIVKRLHEILENEWYEKKPSVSDLVKQLCADFEMDLAACEGFEDVILWEYEEWTKKPKIMVSFKNGRIVRRV